MTTRIEHETEQSAKNDDTVPAPDWSLGALCAEAQADGVPCTELGRQCEECEHAVAAAVID